MLLFTYFTRDKIHGDKLGGRKLVANRQDAMGQISQRLYTVGCQCVAPCDPSTIDVLVRPKLHGSGINVA